MRIISRKPNKKILKETPCTNCGIDLEYVPKDTHKYIDTDMYGDRNYTSIYIICPDCKHHIEIERIL